MGIAEDLREAGTSSTNAARVGELSTHRDRRVRVLAARHSQLPAPSLAVLAADSEPAVRAALVSTHALEPAQCVALLRDESLRVRRAVVRHQNLPFELLKGFLESGRASAVVLERMRQFLADPGIAEALINEPRWAYFAADGAFRYEFVAALLAQRQLPWVVSRMAAVGTLDDRTALLLARHDDRAVQEAIGGRSDLSKRVQRRIALQGGNWARAAIVRRPTPDAIVRWSGRVGVHRVLRRARAEVTTSRLALAWLSCSAHWDVKAAVAANPALGGFVQRQLTRSGYRAVGVALARRPDLSEQSIARLARLHLMVRLELAANPHLLPESMNRLGADADPFVAGVATSRATWPTVSALIDNPTTPAWVLRRVALGDRATADEKDRLLVWLALGGGNGDPNFDPLSCAGTPGVAGYRLESGSDNPWDYLTSPLWRTRILAGQGRGSLGHEVVHVLAMDPHVAVRRVAAGYRSLNALKGLRFDADPSVTTQALTTLQSTERTSMPLRQFVRVFGRRLALPLAVVLGVVTLSRLGGGNDDPFPPQPPVLADAASIVAWKLDPLLPASELQRGTIDREPRFAPICVTSSGAKIWVQSVVGPDALNSYVKVAVKRTDRDSWVYSAVFDERAGPPEVTGPKVPVFDAAVVVLGWATQGGVGRVRVEIQEVPRGAEPRPTYRVTIPFGPDAVEATAYGGCI